MANGRGKAAIGGEGLLHQPQMSIQQQLRQRAMEEEAAKNQKKAEFRQWKQRPEKFRERHKKYLQERGREATKEHVEEPKSGKVHDINDQVQVVQKWWSQMQQEDLEELREKGQANATIRL